jgi:sulfur carrier protein ThiS
MKNVQANTQQETYQPSGATLQIYWDEQMVERDDETVYVYRFCEVPVTANRNQIIEAVIATEYTTGAEFAAINNRDVAPDAYAAYQAFRATAKALADGWINR